MTESALRSRQGMAGEDEEHHHRPREAIHLQRNARLRLELSDRFLH